jgi:hypothetical protein
MYSSKRNAEQRREQFLARGVQAELHTLYRPRPEFWIDLEPKPDDTTSALAERIRPLAAELPMTNRPCPR